MSKGVTLAQVLSEVNEAIKGINYKGNRGLVHDVVLMTTMHILQPYGLKYSTWFIVPINKITVYGEYYKLLGLRTDFEQDKRTKVTSYKGRVYNVRFEINENLRPDMTIDDAIGFFDIQTQEEEIEHLKKEIEDKQRSIAMHMESLDLARQNLYKLKQAHTPLQDFLNKKR